MSCFEKGDSLVTGRNSSPWFFEKRESKNSFLYSVFYHLQEGQFLKSILQKKIVISKQNGFEKIYLDVQNVMWKGRRNVSQPESTLHWKAYLLIAQFMANVSCILWNQRVKLL